MIKKLLLGGFVLGLILVASQAKGATLPDGCYGNATYSITTGQKCNSGSVLGDSTSSDKSINTVNPKEDTDPVVIPTCGQTAPGSESFVLDINNPSNQTVSSGATNVELARIKMTNTGSQNICYLNGLQIGSNENVNSYITNVRVIDLTNNSQIGLTATAFSFNGNYYWSWAQGFDLAVMSGSSKTFKIVGDIKPSALAGQFKFGIFGANHSGGFGAYSSGLPIVGNLITIGGSSVVDLTPRIAYWWGKVNQHVDAQGNWLTDPDGVSGADLDKLTYCKKWYPRTTSIREYRMETITGWRERGNIGGPYTLAVMTTECVPTRIVLPPDTTCSSVSDPSIIVLSPNGGEVYQAGQQITVKWKSCNISSRSLVSIHSRFRNPGPNGGVWSTNLLPDPHTTNNDGTETVSLPTEQFILSNNAQLGRNFEILVVLEPNSNNTTMDNSDSLFTINGTQQTGCIINYFTANPMNVVSGSVSTLSLSTDGCVSVGIFTDVWTNVWTNLNGQVSSTVATGPLTQTTTYTLFAGALYTGCTSVAGYSLTNGQPCTTGTQTATVTVVVSNIPPSSAKVYLMGGLINEAGGNTNDIWSTSNMTTWNQILSNDPNTGSRWSPRGLFNSAVYFQDKLWVLGNKDDPAGSNDIWSSSDGITWTQMGNGPWSARDTHSVAVFNNKLWILGGQSSNGTSFYQLNDVWSSSDGINWNQATSNAPWTPRANSASVVFNNKLWILGGTNNNGANYGDVWSTANGINWTQENINAFLPRGYHTATVFNGKIWVMGGFATGSTTFDIVSSSDGVVWTTTGTPGPWGYRSGHSVVVQNNKMWLLGGAGQGGVSALRGDIWSTTDGTNWIQEVASAPWPPRFYQSAVVTPSTFGRTISTNKNAYTDVKEGNTSISGSVFNRTLKIGLRGEDVKSLQSLLGITTDGIYGKGTAAKVKEWQASNGLKADGSFGAESRAVIK